MDYALHVSYPVHVTMVCYLPARPLRISSASRLPRPGPLAQKLAIVMQVTYANPPFNSAVFLRIMSATTMAAGAMAGATIGRMMIVKTIVN